MEKVFAAPSSLKEKFDVTTFQDTVHPIGSYKSKNGKKIYENKYNTEYGNELYCFIFFFSVHRPKNLNNDLNIEEDSEYEHNNEKNNAQNYDDIPEDFPLVSERAGHGDHSVSVDVKLYATVLAF